MNIETIKSQLVQLRLPSAAQALTSIVEQQKKAVHLGWLSELLQNELDARKQKSLSLRIKSARFPEITSLESFDFGFNPGLDESAIRELATLKFLETNEIALFLGPPGVGKTHIALAIGHAVVRSGKRVYCSSAKRLSQEIMAAKMRNTLDMLFKKILSSHLWILDDWGVVSLNKEVAEEIFDLMDRRKHSTAMILTSNRDVAEWGQVFPDLVLVNAIIDRIFDRAKTIIFEGESYRLKGRIKLNLKKP